MAQRKFYQSLYLQVIMGILIGALLGHFYPEAGAAMKPLGDGFIKLIKMMIAPIIFCTVVTGVAGMENMKAVGKTGGLAILYFEVVSTLALVLGLVIVNVVRPGVGMNVNPATLDTNAMAAYHITGSAAADLQGRGGRHRQRLHRAGGDALGGRPSTGRGVGVDPRH